MSAVVQEAFVTARQSDSSVNVRPTPYALPPTSYPHAPFPPLQADALHRWLALARLVGISRGEDQLTQAAWDQSRRLDAAREERCRSVNPAPSAAPQSPAAVARKQ